MSLVSINDVLKITTRVEKIHPYKVVGNRDSYSPYNEGWSDCVNLIEHYLEQIPSAEPERKTGEWIEEKINSYTSRTYCSECGSSAPFVYESDDYYGNHAHGKTAKTKFCPQCGADMRGGNENAE